MSTEAQLKAISNSELASGNQIPALKHRTVNNAIIEEMYDAQSRADVLAGVQTAVSIASGDQVLVIRSGQAYLLDSSEFGFVDALADLTDVSIPTPANDQVLAYNTTTSKWEAKDVNTLTSVVSISGTATTNALTKFTGTSSIGNSILSDNGTTVTIGGNLSVNNNLTVGTINSGTSSDFVKGDGSLDSTIYQDTSEKDQANGYAPLDSGAKIPLANLPDSILGQVSYQGTWAASTNTPTLANPPASTTKGEYYVASDDGTQFGIEFVTGDWIISNGSAWEKVDNTDAVTSVFGRIGPVVANAGDYDQYYVNLDGDQIITGEKTFSGDSLLIADAGNGLKGRFKNTSINSAQDSGYATFGFNGSNNLFFTKATSANFNGGVFAWDNNDAIRTYTLQDASGTLAFTSDLTDFVTLDTAQTISAAKTFTNTGSANTVVINHTSGSAGIALDITKSANGEGLKVNKTSGTGNAATIIGTLEATDLVGGSATITGNLAVDTDTLFVDASANRVGIGTDNPSAKLHVVGDAEINGTLDVKNGSDTTSVKSFGIEFDRNTSYLRPTTNGTKDLFIGGLSSGDQDWNNVVFRSDNEVEINTVTFDVNTTSTTINGDLAVDTDTLFVDSTNNRVGIGTSSPAFPLHILSSTDIVQYESNTNGLYNQYKSTVGIFGYVGSGSQTVSGGATTDFGIQSPLGGILFATGGNTERMRIDSSGNVWGRKNLALNDTVAPKTTFSRGGLLELGVNGSTIFGAADGWSSNNWLYISNNMYVNSSNTFAASRTNPSSLISMVNNEILFSNAASTTQDATLSYTERMRIESDGGIFFNSLGGFSVSNSDVRYNTTSKELYYQTSSKRYKSEITDLESCLSKVNNLRPVRFKDNSSKQYATGMIAEEVAKIIPEVVFVKPIDGFDEPQIEGINYSDLTPFLIKAMQEQQEIINDMKAEIETLKQQINGQ